MKKLLILSLLYIPSSQIFAQQCCTNDSIICGIQSSQKGISSNKFHDNKTACGKKAGNSFIDQFPIIENRIIQFYENEVFHTSNDHNFKISDICTDGFLKRLQDANEYDSDGYATWLLRSGMQDGDNSPSRVLSVVPSKNNTIIVNWSDMGHKGSTTLNLIESNGSWKIDNATVPEGFNPL